MDNSLNSVVSETMLLELAHTYRSMPELDVVLFTTLKRIQTSLKCGGVSIWLLDKDETKLECTHVVGAQSEDMLGSLLPASEILAAFSASSTRELSINDFHPSAWMDEKIYSNYFDKDAKNVLVKPLLARDELVGVIVIDNRSSGSELTKEGQDFIKNFSVHIAAAIQNIQLYQRQEHINKHLKLLNQISLHLHQTLDIDELFPLLFNEVNKGINAEGQSIWLVDETAGVVKCRFAVGPGSDMLIGFIISLDVPSIVGTSISKKESIITQDAKNDPRRARSADEQTGFITHSLMTVPLVLGNKSIGAIQAVNKRSSRELFNQADLDLFRSIADSAALAVNNAQLVTDLEKSYDLTLATLSSALDSRDRETEGHSLRVVEYTSRLARQLGMDKASIKKIRRGALIHDIGKIGIPDAILSKPGSLNEEERKIIERHPLIGYSILAGIPYLLEEANIVVYHHEKWDGTGYPFGLRAEQIPEAARLFAIIDTFDALVSDRPYRQGRSYEIARKIIEEESGKQFDPQAVLAFLAIPPEEWAQIHTKIMGEVDEQRAFKDKLDHKP